MQTGEEVIKAQKPVRRRVECLSGIHLRRITSSVAYIPEIDGIRFFAIWSVILFHITRDITNHSAAAYLPGISANPVFWVTSRLSFGVQAFFVVSGFVLALPFARQYLKGRPAPTLKRYFLRRLTRLEPPYILALVYFFALNTVRGRGTFAFQLRHLLASIIYQHNLIYGAPSETLLVAWSLEIEVQFYLLAPVIAAIAFRAPSKVLRRTGLVLGMVLSAWIGNRLALYSPRIDLSLLGQLPYFLSGFLLADFYSTQEQGDGQPGWDAVSVVAAVLIFVAIYFESLTIFLAPTLLFLAYYGVLHGSFLRKFLSLSFISTVGGMCYSIYLLHNYAISLCGRHSEQLAASMSFPIRMAIQLLLMSPVILGLSGCFFVLIERPCMQPDWPSRLMQRWYKIHSPQSV